MHMLGERIVMLLLLTLWLDLFAPVVLSTSFWIREDLCRKKATVKAMCDLPGQNVTRRRSVV